MILGWKKRLGEDQTEIYRNNAQKYWDRVCDIELTPVPDIPLLQHIGRSPFGTLFPRYLVKALRELLSSAHRRGLEYCYDTYRGAEKRRDETVRQWKEQYPDETLADDPTFIYHRT